MAGRNRYDFTPLFADAAAFGRVTKDLAEPFRNSGVEKVAALDALGFTLGGSVAVSLGAGLVLIRKEGKIPWHTVSTKIANYSGEVKGLELAEDAVQPGERVLLVDDWSETGAQLVAAVELIQKLKGCVVGVALIGCDERVREVPELFPELFPFRFVCLVDAE